MKNAARQIRKLLARQHMEEGGLRIALKAGGCSGFEYVFALEPAPSKDDHVFRGPDSAMIFVDPRSFRLLDGTVLDYDTSLISRSFLLENPHAKSTCGCGISFSVEDDTRLASPDGAPNRTINDNSDTHDRGTRQPGIPVRLHHRHRSRDRPERAQ